MNKTLSTVASNGAKSSFNGQPTQRDGSEYFDLHTRGCGYLSRVRWVETSTRGRKSAPFLCCAINALHGDVTAPSYTYFDLRVTGGDAQQLIASLEQYVEQKRRVFVAFSVGDIYAHPYERNVIDQKTQKPAGKEQCALIKGRLLQVTFARVDDVVIYSATGITPVDDRDTAEQTPMETAQDTVNAPSDFEARPAAVSPSPRPQDDGVDSIY